MAEKAIEIRVLVFETFLVSDSEFKWFTLTFPHMIRSQLQIHWYPSINLFELFKKRYELHLLSKQSRSLLPVYQVTRKTAPTTNFGACICHNLISSKCLFSTQFKHRSYRDNRLPTKQQSDCPLYCFTSGSLRMVKLLFCYGGIMH